MIPPAPPLPPRKPPAWRENCGLIARLVLGLAFLYLGYLKATAPVDFLRVAREYPALEGFSLLNSVAIILPWLEVFCGLLLILGIAVRGTALLALGMLIPFSILVFSRAVELQNLTRVPFCSVRFDCGCGSGEVLVCLKLAENALLALLAAWLLVVPQKRWTMRPSLFPRPAGA